MQKVDISAQLGLNNFERAGRITKKLYAPEPPPDLRPVRVPIVNGAISLHCARLNATPNSLADLVLQLEPEGTTLVGLRDFRRIGTGETTSVVGVLTETGLILPQPESEDLNTLAVRISYDGGQDLIGVGDTAGEVAFPGADSFDIGSYARVCLDAISKRT